MNIYIFRVKIPHHSPLQMTTVLDDNVHNFAVDGSSDDLDVPIKAVFADLDYTARYTVHGTLVITVHFQAQLVFYQQHQLGQDPGADCPLLLLLLPAGGESRGHCRGGRAYWGLWQHSV